MRPSTSVVLPMPAVPSISAMERCWDVRRRDAPQFGQMLVERGCACPRPGHILVVIRAYV